MMLTYVGTMKKSQNNNKKLLFRDAKVNCINVLMCRLFLCIQHGNEKIQYD